MIRLEIKRSWFLNSGERGAEGEEQKVKSEEL